MGHEGPLLPHLLCVYARLQMCVRAFYEENLACKQRQLWNIFLMLSFLADTTE